MCRKCLICNGMRPITNSRRRKHPSAQSRRTSGRGGPRVQRLESDDRPGKARLVRHWSVKDLWVGTVAGQFRFMHQRPSSDKGAIVRGPVRDVVLRLVRGIDSRFHPYSLIADSGPMRKWANYKSTDLSGHGIHAPTPHADYGVRRQRPDPLHASRRGIVTPSSRQSDCAFPDSSVFWTGPLVDNNTGTCGEEYRSASPVISRTPR